jgi:hypothetical protein
MAGHKLKTNWAGSTFPDFSPILEGSLEDEDLLETTSLVAWYFRKKVGSLQEFENAKLPRNSFT